MLVFAPLLATLLACLAPPGELVSETSTPDARGVQAAEAEATAKRLETEEGGLVLAAEAWERAFANAIDADTRGHAAFRAQKAYREAARSTGQAKLLCDAQRVVLANLERSDLEEDERQDFDGFRGEIATALSKAETTCDEVPLAEFLAVEVSPRADDGERLADRELQPSAQPTSMSSEQHDAKSRSQASPKKIVGGVLLGTGAALLGVATYGIIEDRRAAQAIIAFAPKNHTVGLTETEIAALRAEQDRARLGSRLAIGAGISAGAAIITGAVLLALPSKRQPKERRALALQPSLSPLHAGFHLRGSF